MPSRRRLGLYLATVSVAALVSVLLCVLIYRRSIEIGKGVSHAKVSFRLNWIPDPTFTGAYMAKRHRMWRRRNVSVDIKAGGMNIDPIRLVADGTDEFGVVGANRLLEAISKGYDIVAVCVEMQTNPVGWVVRSDSDIRDFGDFVGHRIGLKIGDESETIMKAVFAKMGISESSVELVRVGFSPDPFITGLVDALPVYINEEPHTIQSRGVKVRVLHPSSIGISLYGNVVFTSRRMLEERGSVVQSFVSGLLDGWYLARKMPSNIVAKELQEIEPRMKDVPTEEVLLSTLKLVFGMGEKRGARLGWMNIEDWQKTARIMEKYANVYLERDIASVFTNVYVENYYKSDGKR